MSSLRSEDIVDTYDKKKVDAQGVKALSMDEDGCTGSGRDAQCVAPN